MPVSHSEDRDPVGAQAPSSLRAQRAAVIVERQASGVGRRLQVTAFTLGAPLAAHAQSAPAEAPSLLPLVIVLVLVLALIPLAVWLLKRLGGAVPASVAGLRVIAQLPLGPRERIVVVEAGDRWLLLGVTSASITRIGTLPKGEAPATPANFASLLSTARDRWVKK